MLPNFLVIGAGKAATSWLHVCLDEHPDVFVPQNTKEIHFFSLEFDKGFDWYESFFAHYNGQKAVGEISPTYIHHLYAPQRICDCNPNIALICILRDPIQRAYSHYRMLLRAGLVSEDIVEELSTDSELVLLGEYYQFISRYLEWFSKEQMLFLIYEDLKKDPKAFLKVVFDFLNVDSSFEPTILNKKYHKTKTRPRSGDLYKIGNAILRWIGERGIWGWKTREYLRKTILVDLFHRLNQGPEYPTIPFEHGTLLANHYLPNVKDLSELIQRDLPEWLIPYVE